MIVKRRRKLSYASFWDKSLSGFCVVLVALIVGSFIGGVAYSIAYSTHNGTVSDRRAMATMVHSYGEGADDISPDARAQRMDIAQKMLDLDWISVNTKGASDYRLSKDEFAKLQKVSETGDPMPAPGNRWAAGDYMRFVYLWPGLPLLLMMFGVAMLISYADKLDVRYRMGYRIADLPWRYVWPWFFAFIAGPIGWIAYGYSAKKLRTTPLEPEREQYHPYYDDEPGYNPQAPITTQAVLAQTAQSYVRVEDRARERFVALRTGGVVRRRELRLDEIKTILADNAGELRSFGEQIKDIQSQNGKLNAEKQRVEEEIATGNETITAELANGEFDSIKALPGVLAVRPAGDGIAIIVRTSTMYNGVKYDLGDWELSIAHRQPTDIFVKCVRKSTINGHRPFYEYGSYGFCLGNRSSVIHQHLARSQYLQALSLLIECVNTVNKGEQFSIPEVYSRLEEHVPASA